MEGKRGESKWHDPQFKTPNLAEWAKRYKDNPYGKANESKPEDQTWSEYYSRKAKQENQNLAR